MKFIIFFIYIPFVYSELHSFITTYTGISGQMTADDCPEFSAVTTLDDQQIDYYDSNIKKLIPRQYWMKEFASEELWKEDNEIREQVWQVYKNNIPVLMKRFNQSHGVHTFQRMYGCEWDDKTGDSNGFDQYGYDGEDFISLDIKEGRYTESVQQAELTVMKWNNNKEQLEILQEYFGHECVYWLKEFLYFPKATFKKADHPKVSLLQKNPDSPVECHVTDFLFRNTIISWRKNGQAMSDSSKLVKSGDTLPNEDGTFQRTLNLSVPPDEYKKDQYTCVVEHKSLTETIQKTVKEIKSSIPGSDASSIMYHVLMAIITVIFLLTVLCVLWKCREKFKACNTQGNTHSKHKARNTETQEDRQALTSTPEISTWFASPEATSHTNS
ncbi:major histocompatibility complex class I-related gene protein-like [Megalobrama amblycephala]|uniref:major histocompatibility complex class I-related gene protein-like n=1 Tax=Megalobrama amblycephala TaxID=75352 RepID=UPI0020146069|nr:major histocompatibility complex class I-related gene protein-like [Megalobrama amblycephala]